MGKAFEKQLKAIESQAEKQIKAIQDQGQVKTIKKYIYNNEDTPLISKQKDIFNELVDERLEEITDLDEKVNSDNLLNGIKVLVFFEKNFEKSTCTIMIRIKYFFKSNIPAINLIVGLVLAELAGFLKIVGEIQQLVRKLSQKIHYNLILHYITLSIESAKKLSVFGENDSRRLSNFLKTHIF